MGFFTDLKEDLSQAVNELGAAEEKNMDEAVIAETVNEQEDIVMEQAETEIEQTETVIEQDEAVMEQTEEELMDQFELEMENSEQSFDMPTADMGEYYVPKYGMSEKKMTDEVAVITAGMTINGDVSTEGSMDLIGTVVGNISVLGKLNVTGCIQGDSRAAEIYADRAKITGEINSQGSVKIGNSSVIIGNIFANSAVIAGAVKGDIDIQGPVLLDSTAIVMGNIRSKSVQINNGAVIEGMCSQCYSEVNPVDFFEEFKKDKK